MAGSLDDLYRRPGFVLRRCHQIAVSIFLEEAQETDLTTTQFGVLTCLGQKPGIDQIGLARLLGLDRSTTGTVVARLVARGLVRRDRDHTDRRRRRLLLTPEGAEVLDRVAGPAERARERLLAPLSAEEQGELMQLLDRIAAANNGTSRVPLIPSEPDLEPRGGQRCEMPASSK